MSKAIDFFKFLLVFSATVAVAGCAANLGSQPTPVSKAEVVTAMPKTVEKREYRINPGDILEISVWKEEGMEKQVKVLPDGTISFPLIGFVSVAGSTPAEVQETVTSKMRKFIPYPVVTVSVKEAAGNTIYVIGFVDHPGQFHPTGPIDVLQALSLAGGLTTPASETEVRVIRREDGAQKVFTFNYAEVKKGLGLESNILLESGDVIVVPGGGFFQ